MDGTRLPRRRIALVAAYGLALQALLAVMVAVPLAAAFASVTCSAESSKATNQP